MNTVAYIVSAITIAITLVLLFVTFIPLTNKTIKLNNKTTIIWFIVILIIALVEIVSINVAMIGEISEYMVPAPSYIWLIFKIFSLAFLWIWSFFYFFIWIQFKKS